MVIFKRKVFTKYDDTDALKQMKDSDILAQEKKKAPGYGGVAAAAATGATVGAATGSIMNAFRKKPGTTIGGRMMKGGKYGALAGGIAMGLMAANKREKEAKDASFYNKRLNFAQRQARRREKKDWNTNMTQRQGYTY